MKQLLALLTLLYSASTYSAVGDVYSCDMNKFVKVKGEESTFLEPQQFDFRWLETEIEFDGDGYFGISLPLTLTVNLGDVEVWKATGQKADDLHIQSEAIFRQGSLIYSYLSYNDGSIYAITATCQKL
tara:strand:+ start:992 stop:1375 length:384 start_codon:yes stop_codon:yes gene_type:complete